MHEALTMLRKRQNVDECDLAILLGCSIPQATSILKEQSCLTDEQITIVEEYLKEQSAFSWKAVG